MTSSPWTAERLVGSERAAALLGRAAPHLDLAGLHVLAEGWDNTVLTTGADWIARFPRRATALPGVRREAWVLPRVAALLPRPVPAPRVVAVDDDPAEPWPFTVNTLVPGVELAEAGLSDADRVGLAGDLGAFLRVLHSPAVRAAALEPPGGPPVGPPGEQLPVDPMDRAWPRPRVVAVRRTLDALAAAGTWRPDPRVGALLDRAARLGPPPGEPVLVHGDLHVRHVLVPGRGPGSPLSGVIDWGDLCLADPAVDLGVAYAAFTGAAREALLAAYGGLDGERELRARALAVRISALLADYAAGDGRPVLLAEALAGLQRAVS